MAFCFPGYDATGSDLPPPPICAATWHARVMAALPGLDLLLLVGGAAQRWHLNTRAGVGATVAAWRDHAPRVFPLPHPSWRTAGWQKRHPWFAAEVVPALQQAVRAALENP
jgi:uracil-DNA glycosylase